jgi:hypothetical protein
MNLQSFMWHLVNLQPAYRQADFKVSIPTIQKPFEQPTQKAFYVKILRGLLIQNATSQNSMQRLYIKKSNVGFM